MPERDDSSRPEQGKKKLTFANVPRDTLRALVQACEGHNIFSPADLVEGGIPQDAIDPLVEMHESGFGSPSQAIFTEGRMVRASHGVHDLPLLRQMCADLGVSSDTHGISGRGFQATVLKTRLLKHLEPPKPE